MVDSPYYAQFEGETFVIQAEDEAVDNQATTRAILEGIEDLLRHGIRVLLVFGKPARFEAELRAKYAAQPHPETNRLVIPETALPRIRERMARTRILQMPMTDCAGKLSYPFEIKKTLFSTLFQAFPDNWKSSVFFYMCMEDVNLWEPVFGRSYPSNEAFEQDMIQAYRKKIHP